LEQLGVVATTLSGGARAKWDASYAEAFHGADVVLYADNDPPGWDYVQRIAHGLSGVAKRLRIVSFPDFPKGFDIADWLHQAHTREDLEALIAAAPEWQPSDATASLWDKAIAADAFLRQEDTQYEALATDLVVPGAITVVAAPRGTFKSITTLALGIALATGGRFRGQCVSQVRVLLIDRDNPPHVIRQRLHKLGATGVQYLKVLTRDMAPPLTDKAKWAAFPV
jgi:hypothetical protein